MHRKRSRLPDIPAKYRRYVPKDWPGGWAQWTTEREAWNAAQPPVVYAGSSPSGLSWAYEAGPLGDICDMMSDRRAARIIDSGNMPNT